MLGFKSFKTAATTLAGIELAHRICKRQFSLGHGRPRRDTSLKQLWDRALAQFPPFDSPRRRTSLARPPTHQNSGPSEPTKTQPDDAKLLRYARKIFVGRGLYMLVMPKGGRYWRYNYRFDGRHKTLALGIHPDVSLDKARARHQVARTLLADGIDPAARKRALGNRAFVTSPD